MKNLTWQNPEQLFVAQELINKVKSKCCGIKDIENTGKKSVTLYRFASAFLPLQRGDNWMTHFHGSWAAEHTMEEEKLTNGQKVISNKDGMCNTEQDNPSFLLSMNGRATEESGDVFGGTLAWTGNYLIKVIASNTTLSVSAGINEETSFYKLEREEIFSTPEFCMTYSKCGKGGVSRGVKLEIVESRNRYGGHYWNCCGCE